ncbi:hypothetical protein [Lysobacter sp. Root690]|uniref:hypothetical protein n=1 Tax=Lysobacter sp. Root690 TaxID=1736588 RepID=UPI000AF2A192|nr:hypothetical protein [Lysobacter sp. Root690]
MNSFSLHRRAAVTLAARRLIGSTAPATGADRSMPPHARGWQAAIVRVHVFADVAEQSSA